MLLQCICRRLCFVVLKQSWKRILVSQAPFIPGANMPNMRVLILSTVWLCPHLKWSDCDQIFLTTSGGSQGHVSGLSNILNCPSWQYLFNFSPNSWYPIGSYSLVPLLQLPYGFGRGKPGSLMAQLALRCSALVHSATRETQQYLC